MKIYKAKILNPISVRKVEILDPGYLAVSDRGIILACAKNLPARFWPTSRRGKAGKIIDLKGKIIMPGLVDAHTHLPQYAVIGKGRGQLLPWLKNYIFPREAQFLHARLARQSAKTFFDDLVKNGTTTAAIYCTIHRDATDIAFKTAYKKGLRVIMGKVMMDQNSPSALLEKTEKSLRDSEFLIKKWHAKDGRIFYALTPRFAITCSEKLMKGAAKLAKKYGAYIQTHLAENLDEIKTVKKLFPKAKNYTDVYRSCGLLGKKTIMAHCIYLSPIERNFLRKTGTAIAHCPTSNKNLKSGMMPYLKWASEGLKIGLGTDVAGGNSLSMFNEMKEAIKTAKKYAAVHGNKKKNISPEEALYMATLGSAKALGLDKKIGNFAAKKEADFIIITCGGHQSPLKTLHGPIFRTGSASIKAVFVKGKQIG